jgi:hypothetical protein
MTVTVHTLLPAPGAQNVTPNPEMVLVVTSTVDITGFNCFVNGASVGESPYPDYRGAPELSSDSRRITLRFRARRYFLSSGKVTVRYVVTTSEGDSEILSTFYIQSGIVGVVRQRDRAIDRALPASYVAASVVQTTVRGLLLNPGPSSLFAALVRVTVGGTLRSFASTLKVTEDDLVDAEALNGVDLLTLDADTLVTHLSVLEPLWPAFLDELRGADVLETTVSLINKTWQSPNRVLRLEAASAALLFIHQALS